MFSRENLLVTVAHKLMTNFCELVDTLSNDFSLKTGHRS